MRSRTVSTILLILVSIIAPSATAGVMVSGWVKYHQLFFSEPHPGVTAPQLVFADEKPRLEIRVFMNPLRRGPKYENVKKHEQITFGTTPWWTNAWLRFENHTTGETRTIPASDLRFVAERSDREGGRESVNAIRDDEIVYAEFDLPPFALGDYHLIAELKVPQVGSQPEQMFRSDTPFAFSVRRGDEDVDTRRAYLRARAQRLAATPGVGFDLFRTTVEELMQLEPKNPGNLEWLGDLAVSLSTAEEATAYYDRTLELIRTNLIEKFGPPEAWSSEVKEFWSQRERALTVVRRASALAKPGSWMSVLNDGRSKRILLYTPGEHRARHID